ncbi:disease resistance protein RUN1-like [Eucalyptus grandis]|uniref:disease resistance protein RUN1-like n=1 Tax=Eucalyptus grandis TaxID=71139 RepID=UPI00192F0FE9|nr:disease resistance protein RUN1-like [Eucalyptus grandis]
MAYSEAGSGSDAAQISGPGRRYEVFLNFRGPDTRHGFTDFLYHGLVNAGVCTFMDDKEFRIGKAVSGGLLPINRSRFYIAIFSLTYASSIRCLRELVYIVDNVSMSKGTKSIIPIFFYVKPDDVKLETRLYEDALLEHKKQFPDEVERWRAALAAVGSIKGWEVNENRSQAWVVESIVVEVLVKLETRKKVLTKHLVGLDDQIKELTEILDVDHPVVQLIGIYGMGGIGKTTVAKVVFNILSSHFGKTCCFLENIRENSFTKEGIFQLQKKLLSDIGGGKHVKIVDHYEQGMMMIERVLNTKKVLVVLDDVAEEQHIEYLIGRRPLAPGSRIIITTRDQTIIQVKWFNGDIRRYEIPKMDDAVALQLFCRHAFDRDFPLNDYRKHSSEIVSIMGQLPLAIEVIGSSLKGQCKEIWEENLIYLRNVLNREVRKKLQISYDGLDKFEKQIFLDIACFFFNEKKTDAIYVWDDCLLDPLIRINILTQKCLIKVLDNGKLWMHNQLIALGRQIVSVKTV